MRSDPLLIVGGCPRSGTTLVRNILNAHPQLAIPTESPFIYQCLQELVTENAVGDLPRAWRLIAATPHFERWELPTDAVRAEVATTRVDSYAELIRALFAAYATDKGKAHPADKTPGHLARLELLTQLFPSTRMVRLLRDPRDVAMRLSVQHFSLAGVARAAVVWRNNARATRRGLRAIDADRVLDLRYETLVLEPAREISRVCRHAGLAFDESMLDHEHRAGDEPGFAHRSARRAVTPGLSWRSEMSIDEVALVEIIVGDEMELLGYPRVAGRRAQLRALPAYLRERGGNYVRGRIRARWGWLDAPAVYEVPDAPVTPLTPDDVT